MIIKKTNLKKLVTVKVIEEANILLPDRSSLTDFNFLNKQDKIRDLSFDISSPIDTRYS